MCVHMDCSGCEDRVRKALRKLEGVDDIDIDMANQKVTVTGYVEQKKVLKAVRKTGRRAVLWPFPHNPETAANFSQHYAAGSHHPATTFTANPFAYSTASSSSYNYRKHGYDESMVQGYYHMPAGHGVVGERAGAMFSDENPNACSVM